ncbi:MAG: hypothetical protein N838_23290 [Thiohalocapsa sp. PB-PSB1]|nr:MAG: hypothetical protein N838_23290 [Thiohalocapsa sp. PB-PSB1]
MLPRSEQARLFKSLPLVCPNCGAYMRIIAFLTEAVPVQRILAHIGEPTEPLPLAPARLGRCARPGAGLEPPPTARVQLRALSDWDQRIAW